MKSDQEKIEILRQALNHYADPEVHVYVDFLGKPMFDNSQEGPRVARQALNELDDVDDIEKAFTPEGPQWLLDKYNNRHNA